MFLMLHILEDFVKDDVFARTTVVHKGETCVRSNIVTMCVRSTANKSNLELICESLLKMLR